MSTLKPFPFTILDLDFMQSQIAFRPLFDANGQVIINWDGTGAIYDANGALLYSGAGLTPAEAIAQFGVSFPTYTSSAGLRDIDGFHNNLFNFTWGNTDQPFLQTTPVIFDGYIKPLDHADPNAFYSLRFANSPGVADYTKRGDNLATQGIDESSPAQSVVDYTPRMISRLVTTAGVTFETLPGSNHLVKDVNGYEKVADYGLLQALGQQDGQRAVQVNGDITATGFVADTDPATNTNQEWFIGGTNPGVAPVNGWFALFGQFFDHGLDFISKGADGTKITINLAPDDPMYGVIDPNTGQPATKIVISRADVSGFTADGTPQWINHTSPYIDQSQTYGSHEQLTSLLREWVLNDPANPSSGWRMGANMFDGHTSVAWVDGFGNTTTATLPTLNELRANLIATGRDDLTWEDVLNLRNRDATGHVIDSDPNTAGIQAVGSGAALLLDMNPRFDNLRFENALNPDAGAEFQASIATLNTAAQAVGGTFSYDGTTILLDLPAGVMGANAVTLTGASALALWVDFANFGIRSMQAPPGVSDTLPADVHDAVSNLLMAAVGDHYVAGDGRVNENMGLTAVHHVFHEEHNYQVENLKQSIAKLDLREAALDPSNTYNHQLLNAWQVDTGQRDAAGNYVYADESIAWNDDMLFNAAKMTVEMEYQHTAVDQFARTITPNLHEFVGYNSGENSTISVNFSQVAYRFGHSTLRESIDLMDPNGSVTGAVMRVALERAFLSPEKFAAVGAGAIALGMTHQQANEIDEFLTPAMNQGLLGQPLDLAAINIARGRDVGVPTLNDMREALQLSRYTSWADFGANMLHQDNLVSFVAAYAFDGNLARAQAIFALANDQLTDAQVAEWHVDAGTGQILDGTGTITLDETADAVLAAAVRSGYNVETAVSFLNSPSDTIYGSLAFNQIDSWLGGLAEAHVTGGLLGETFDTIFVDQIGRLMDGDRFYYLQRLNNIPYGQQIIDEQFKDLIERTTGVTHLNGCAFAYADQYYDLGAQAVLDPKTEHKYADALATHPTLGVYSDGGTTTAINGGLVTVGGTSYIRDLRPPSAATKAGDPSGFGLDGMPNSGADSNEVIVATDRNDRIFARAGDDTVYGEAGNDVVSGGAGIDRLYGGAGEDVIYGDDGGDLIDGGDDDDVLYGGQSATAAAGVDQVIGSAGNDYVDGGIGIDKLAGSEGDDVIFGGGDTDAFTHGGEGNDYIDGGVVGDLLWGDNGDDLIVGAADQDIVAGMQGDDILRPGPLSQSLTGGGDEVLGGDGVDDSGNDGKGIGFDLLDLSDWQAASIGANFDFANQANPLPAIDGAPQFPAVTQIEGIIGSRNADTFIGDASNNWLIGGSGDDSMTGGAGNDLIIGDGIRLDALIGTYAGNYDLYFDGASHRAFGYTDIDETTGLQRNFIQSNGVLDAMGWGDQKHFTEMLKSAMFKDLELGGSEVKQLWRNGVNQTTGEQAGSMGDGGTAGALDRAVFTGNFADYTFATRYFDLATRALVTGTGPGIIKVIAVTDSVADRDGTDLVVGVERLEFADRVVNVSPDGSMVANDDRVVHNYNSAAQFQIDETALLANDVDLVSPMSISAITSTADLSASLSPGFVNVTDTGTTTSPAHAFTYRGTGSDTATVTVVRDTSGTIDGDTGNDILIGDGKSSKNDILDGHAGADRMYGGLGNDTYYVDNIGDVVVEAAGIGTDTVRSSVSYALGNNVENLALTGGGSKDGTGNALDNAIVGNNATNWLDGAAGADILTGGNGLDYLTGGLGDDNFYYANLSQSGVTSATRDRILDFTAGDRIWLNAIDANSTIGGDQAFVLDSGGSFSAGEIRQTVFGSNLLVEINTNNSAAAELSILLLGRNTLLGAVDFVL
ncbi:MAG: peroxidase family protein [Hyphomicrobiaceae bacterium]|nr:peroxidase family protein [Hyphomicrobiaceae bacterium]